MVKQISIKTGKLVELLDISHKITEIVRESGIRNGLCILFVTHTTAGITINENADPDVKRDMCMALERIVPLHDGYHHMEGNSAAHIKSSMMGFSETIIISEGRLLLGTWQGIYFCEFDGP
jgi:secondary thiamine-phosphate synthase enzyme